MLIIDTSQKIGVVALVKEGVDVIKKEFDSLIQQKILLPSIIELLENASLNLSDINEIKICTGPGSFTGTRIGVMTAKTFAFTKNIKLTPFHSLLPYHKDGTLTILDAKNGFCFCFDGQTLDKKTYEEVQEINLPIHSISPEKTPIITKPAYYNIENIINNKIESSLFVIYN